MIIEKVDPAREAFGDYSLEGVVLTIAGIAVNLEEEQDEQEVVIPFAACDGKVHRGMTPCCEYVADVIIPPRKYETVEVEGPGTAGSGGAKDEGPVTHTESVPAPLDVDSVTLKLRPMVEQGETPHTSARRNQCR
jgi:hypothetical protein